MRLQRVFTGIVLALLLGGSVLPFVQAQPEAGSPSPTSTSSNTTTSSAAATVANESSSTNSTGRTNRTGPANGTANASAACAQLGTVERAVCVGLLAGFDVLVDNLADGIASGFLNGLRDAAESFIEVLVSRPVPLRDGEMELAQRPTNPPMGAVYDLWLTVGLPAGIAIWALMMLLMQLTTLLPSWTAPVMQSRRKMLEGWFALFRILSSWIWCALVLHLTLGIAIWFAPSGEQIFTSFGSLAETAVSGGIAALVVYLSSGLLFVLVLLVFGLSFLSPFVLMPAYPLFIALSMPDFWIFEWFARQGESLRSLFAPAAFMPVPTAIVLGAGYPVLNAIQGSLTGPVGMIVGIPTYVVLLLVMWFSALGVPLLLFIGARKMRPLSMFAAGALGVATTNGISRGAGKLRGRLRWPRTGESSENPLRNAGVGRTIDPVEGSPFSRENGGGFGGALGSPGGPRIAGALGSRGSSNGAQEGSPTVTQSWQGDDARGNSIGSGSVANTSGFQSSAEQNRVADRSVDEYANTVPDGIEFKQVANRIELDQERYDAGYFDDRGEFKSLSQGPSNAGWLLDEGGFQKVAVKRSEKPVLAYDDTRGEAYDVRGIIQDGEYREARYEQQHEDSIRVVKETRQQ